MGVKRGILLIVAVIILIFFNLADSGYSISINELISRYKFDTSDKIKVISFNDFMLDKDNDNINDTLFLELTLNNSNGNYTFVANLIDNEIIITNETSKNLNSNKINLTFDTSLLSSNKFNYSIKIYNSSYNLKFRIDNIETKIYKNYYQGFQILSISDKKIYNSLSFNLSLNSIINTEAELSIFLLYNNSIIFSKQNRTLINGTQTISINFDNETIKRTHYKGNFNISSIKIGNKIIKQNKLTDYYNYEDFAITSYISSILDKKVDNNLRIDLNLSTKNLNNYSNNNNIDYKIDYNIEAELYDLFNEFIEIKNESFSLNSGKQKVSLDFNGTFIYSKKLNGPYQVRNIKLFEANNLVDVVNEPYITNFYNFSDFIKPNLPDLNITIQASDGYHYGINNITLNVTVKNIGNTPAFNIFLDIFDNLTISKTEQISIFEIGDKKVYQFEFINFSDFEISAIADINNFVEEINESNNADRIIIKINKRPGIGLIQDLTVNETDTIMLNVTAVDNNSDSLKYNINFSKFTNDLNVFKWKTTTTDAGNYTFLVTVTDNYLNDSTLFKLIIIDRPEIDFDNDGINDSLDNIFGDTKNINTSTINTSIFIGNNPNLSQIFNQSLMVEIKDTNSTVVEFEFNFSVDKLNLSKLAIEKQTNNSFGFFLIKGLKLPEGKTKSIYVDKIDNSTNGVCIKDAEITSISQMSSSCDALTESKIECDGSLQNGYSCLYNPTYGKYKVMGLKHSGVKQIDYSKPQQTSNSVSSSGGIANVGGGSGGIGLIHVCNAKWDCTEWSDCKDDKQTRSCIFVKLRQYTTDVVCDSMLNNPVESKDCIEPESSISKWQPAKVLDSIFRFKPQPAQKNKKNITNNQVLSITGFSFYILESKFSKIIITIILIVIILGVIFYRKKKNFLQRKLFFF